MEKLKIKFCNFHGNFKPKVSLYYQIYSKYYDVELCDESPDLVIAGNLGDPFQWAKYRDCPRLMEICENISPDFTSFDYVMGFDFITFSDRYIRMPFAYIRDEGSYIPQKLTREDAERIMKEKKYFCNFIYNHEPNHGMRKKLFDALNEYKEVTSAGPYLNNAVEKGITSNKNIDYKEKYEIVKNSKFTIAVDSISYPGFVTEKITHAFMNHSIPIYFGNPEIGRDFNTDACIVCKGVDDIERVVNEVIRLDNDDEAYMDMLMKCPLPSYDHIKKKYDELESFLLNITSRPREQRIRRVREFAADRYNNCLDQYREYHLKFKKKRKLTRKIRKLLRIR